MTDVSGSYRRFGANDSFPSSRPPNNSLARNLVPVNKLTNTERNIDPMEQRGANMYADKQVKFTDYGIRPLNQNIEGGSLGHIPVHGQIFLGGVGNPQGGSFKSFFKGLGHGIEKGLSVATKLAPLAPLIL